MDWPPKRRGISCEGDSHFQALWWNVAHAALDVVRNPYLHRVETLRSLLQVFLFDFVRVFITMKYNVNKLSI